MSVNKYRPHVYIIPEDEANRKLAIGFLKYHAVDERQADPRPPAGGWPHVLDIFENEYVRLLQQNNAHVVMLIDFDGTEDRLPHFECKIPAELKPRVFVIGSRDDPEKLKAELKLTLEAVGNALAQERFDNDFKLWAHAHLAHNHAELQRLVEVVKPFLFQDGL